MSDNRRQHTEASEQHQFADPPVPAETPFEELSLPQQMLVVLGKMSTGGLRGGRWAQEKP